MDKTTAQRLVRETFKAAFDKKRYRDFINELCNGFNEAKAQSMRVPDAFAPHVKSCQRLGTFESADGQLVDVLIVNLTESYKLERTRTALRDFVAHKLKRGEGEDNAYKEAGLVAFVAPDSKSWRFSFVRMEYETKRDPKSGKIKPEERLTPARRSSYLVGSDEECHTAQSRFLSLLQNTTTKPTLSQIEEAFGVETVTKEFFSQYAALFTSTQSALDGIIKKNATVRADFDAKQVSTVDFAKKLLGQVVFLYFIQKKGWLGVAKGGNWGDGPHNFLRRLADSAIGEKRCFFSEVLEPLFYDTLATDRGHLAWCKGLDCRVPFLNGGLFEPLGGYDWEKVHIDLPNTIFSNRERTPAGDTGSGILDVFDRFNFTVNEAEPLEQEVAIDPEVLGKVFENLIEDNRRKGLGAFYTPREIVHFMCQESLINYLDNGLNHSAARGGGEPIAVSRTDVEEWIGQSDQFAHYAAAIAAGTKGDHYPKPPETIRNCAAEIDALLREITVCDPAIGSGAFPVGMMTEIVRARVALTPYFNDVAERTPYHFKRHAIQSSLYGVDIDVGAVEIAKLRLWLSLVVDELDVQQIKPLPNLDYKVVVGNSLVGVKKTLFNDRQFNQLEALKPKFFDESNRAKKAEYKRQIDALIHELTNGRAAFDFEIYFSEVFHTRGGFDVVIANPPYVRQESIKKLKAALKDWGYESYTGTADLLVYFYERSVKLLRVGGTITFITSNKFYRAAYGEKLRAFLSRELTLKLLIDFADAPVFEAIAYASILTGLRMPPELGTRALSYTWETGTSLERIAEIVPERGQLVLQSELGADGWRLESPTVFRLLEKLRRVGGPLRQLTGSRVYRGVTTGFNEAFVVDRSTRDRLVRESASSAELLKPYLRGRDVNRWRAESEDLWIIFVRRGTDIGDYPAVRKHLLKFKNQLSPGKAGGRKAGSYEWYEIQDNVAYWHEFEKTKILSTKISIRPTFALDTSHCYIGNTSYCFPAGRDSHFLLGLLNSTLFLFYARRVFVEKQGGWFEVQPDGLEAFPVPTVPPAEQKRVARLVELILAAKRIDPSADVTAWEREIDGLVYRIYGLTGSEIKLVEVAAE